MTLRSLLGLSRLFAVGLASVVTMTLFADQGTNLPDFSSLSLQELSEVNVTSVSKTKQKLSQVAAAVYVISQEEIHRSGMTNVADLLRIVPGISVARLDSSKWAVTARGFNGRWAANLLVLIDGRSVYSPIFGGVYWDMSMPLLDDIDRIEVVRGPGASVWGANAVNGVINIITRNADEVTGTSVAAGGGTTERAFGQIRFGGKLTDGISYRSYLSANDRSALQTANGQNGGDGWSDEQGGFRLDGRTKNGGWQLEGDLYRNHRDEVGLFPSAAAGFNYVTSNGNYDALSGNLAFEWRRRLTETSDLRINSYGDYVSRPEPGLSQAETRTGDFEIQYHITAPKGQEITVGLADRVIFEEGPSTGLIYMNPSQMNYQVGSGFAQDEIHMANDRVLLTFGVKLEHDLFAGWQPQPTVRALWAPNTRHSIWAAISRAERAPTFYERNVDAEIGSSTGSMGMFGLPVLATVQGTPNYQSQTLTAYEIGYRAQLSPRLSIDIAGFYDDHRRLKTEEYGTPTLVYGAQPYVLVPLIFSNDLNALAVGGEISATYHPVSRWKVSGSYSFLNVNSRLQNVDPLEVIDCSPNASPRHNFKAQSFLNLTRTVQFDTLVFSSSTVISPIYPSTEFPVPPHTRLDVRLGWRVTPRIEISLSGQDLLNPRHLEMIPEAMTVRKYVPRGYYLKTTWRF